jgi:hypothetical protein
LAFSATGFWVRLAVSRSVRYSGRPISQTNKLIDRAAESTCTWLAEGGLTRRAIPNQMHTHKHH